MRSACSADQNLLVSGSHFMTDFLIFGTKYLIRPKSVYCEGGVRDREGLMILAMHILLHFSYDSKETFVFAGVVIITLVGFKFAQAIIFFS